MKNAVILAMLIFVGVGLTVLADVFLKDSHFSRNGKLAMGVLIYGSTAIFVAGAFRVSTFGSVFTLWESATVIIGILVAASRYHEPLTATRILAVLFAIIAAFLSR
jgi:multidrug transporter EmrE-like cation transporter